MTCSRRRGGSLTESRTRGDGSRTGRPIGTLGKSFAPFLWIARRVHHRVDRYAVILILVEDGIREAPHKCPSVVLVNTCVQLGHPANALDAGIDTGKEVFT